MSSESNARKDNAEKRPRKCGVFRRWMRRHGFLLLLLVATCCGYALGILLQPYKLPSRTIELIGFPGQLLLRAFLMIVVPMVFCNLVLGVSSLRKGGDARMVAVTIGFFLGMSTFSAIMGATAGHLVHPGQRIPTRGISVQSNENMSGRKGVILDSMLDLLWNAIPNNIVQATFSKEYTHVDIVNVSELNDSSRNASVIYRKTLQRMNGVNLMGLLTFSILFGCALAGLGDSGETLHQVVDQLNSVIMRIMNYFLNLLPFGLFFWMFQEGLKTSAATEVLGYLGVFLATAFGCIAIHQFVLYPLLYLVIVRKNPIRYHLNLLPAILTAFATSSSAATLPATMRCAESRNRLNRCVTRFVLPLGMVVHMNGGTMYITLSTIFLAQLEGTELGIADTVILCVTCILMMISAPATAGAGNPVYILTATAAVGIEKPLYISLVLSMEWLLERFRTIMNVVADSYVAAFVEKICWKRLPLDHESIEFISPILDGYSHPKPPEEVNLQPHSGQNTTTVCRCCGSRVNVS